MAQTGAKLRRELNIWETIGISVALMAPSMAANINPQGTAKTVGRAVPLAFVLATVGVLLVSWTFVQLCRRFHHSDRNSCHRTEVTNQHGRRQR